MNLFNKKIYLLLIVCFAFVSMNAQQSDNNDQPLPGEVQKNTYVADANSDNGDVAPEGHVSKNTYVAPKVLDNDGVMTEKVDENKTPKVTKPVVSKQEVQKTPEIDLAAEEPISNNKAAARVTPVTTDKPVLDANQDGIIDNPVLVEQSTTKVTTTNVAKDRDADKDGVVDKSGVSKAKKENN